MADRLLPRRTLICCLPSMWALAACGSRRPSGIDPPDTLEVRTDREPLTKRFPKLGDFVQAHWQAWRIGGSDFVPGPSDIAIQALVTLRPEDLATAKATYDWQGPPRQPKVTQGLQPFVPDPVDWIYSRQFQQDVETGSYSGLVEFDMASGTVFFNVYSM